MSDIRNLTEEAIRYAEAKVISENPNLADKEYRKGMNIIDKQFLFMRLISLGEFYENNIIS